MITPNTTGWVGARILHLPAMVKHFENIDVFTNSIVQYRSIQLRETHRLALNLLDNPDERETMIHR